MQEDFIDEIQDNVVFFFLNRAFIKKYEQRRMAKKTEKQLKKKLIKKAFNLNG